MPTKTATSEVTFESLRILARKRVKGFARMGAAKRRAALKPLVKNVSMGKHQKRLAEELLRIVDLKKAVPAAHRDFRDIVYDGTLFLVSRLSEERLKSLMVEQLSLSEKVSAEERLTTLVKSIPTLHKLGQVIARNRDVEPKLRERLIELEHGLHGTPVTDLTKVIDRELNKAEVDYAIKVERKVLSEASVGAVLPFTWKEKGKRRRSDGVLKVVKPHVSEFLKEELEILEELAEYFDANRLKYPLRDFRYIETIRDVREALLREVDLKREQKNLRAARSVYEDTREIVIPRVLPMSKPDVTAMSYAKGERITDLDLDVYERARCAESLFRAIVGMPLLSYEENSLFHGDPHAGNVFGRRNKNGRLEIVLLDWNQAGTLTKQQRYGILHLSLALMMDDGSRVLSIVDELSQDKLEKDRALFERAKAIVRDIVANATFADMPLLEKTFMLVDRLAVTGIHFPRDLLVFRKVMFTLTGVLRDIDPAFEMDSAMVELLAETLAAEMPARWLNLVFPLWDSPWNYKSLFSNFDLIDLWSHLYSRMLRRGMWEKRAASLFRMLEQDAEA